MVLLQPCFLLKLTSARMLELSFKILLYSCLQFGTHIFYAYSNIMVLFNGTSNHLLENVLRDCWGNICVELALLE